MASAVIHMVVAKEINKHIKRDDDKLLLGSIAPDISKQVGETKFYSHFLDKESNDVPNIDRFLQKYGKYMNDDFVMGYFIHLYTDYLWFKYFITEICDANEVITKLDGTKVQCSGNMMQLYIYNDYTNLNLKLIEEYHIDLSTFCKAVPKLEMIIQEIPMDRLNIIVDKTYEIIEKSKLHKDFVFNLDNVKKFIEMCTELILAKLKEENWEMPNAS